MRIADVVRSGLLICLSFSTGVLESQTVNLSTTEPMAQANAKHKRPEAGLPLSVLRDLPLQFEENKGQAPGSARFLARGAGYTLLLNSDGLELSLRQKGDRPARGLSMHLEGAQASNLLGREQTATQTNYYIGRNPRDWHLDVRSYRSVVYEGVYEGIDLIYHGSGSQLEYDFVISPGSDPAQIRMRFDGLKPLLQGKDLSFEGQDQLRVRALKAFQMLDGKKKDVDAEWEITRDQASIHLGPYDHRHELIIDPIFFYGTYIGGDSIDDAISIVNGPQQGQFYVALLTYTRKLDEPPPPPDVANPKCPKDPNQFCYPATLILKIQATTTDLPIWGDTPQTTNPPDVVFPTVLSATYIGSTTGDTVPISMMADRAFNLYVTGSTSNSAGPPQFDNSICPANCAGYVAKLDSNLTLTYSRALATKGNGISADASGNAYITGMAAAARLTLKLPDMAFEKLITRGSALTSGTHAYLSELGPTGALVFSSLIGGSGVDEGTAVAVSTDRNTVYVTGTTSSDDFPTKCSNCQTSFGHGAEDAFVLAISNLSSNPALEYSTYLGGSGDDSPSSIAVDDAGNVVLVGSTTSTNFPNIPPGAKGPPPFQFTQLDLNGNLTPPTQLTNTGPDGPKDGFVTSLTGDGTLRFTDFLGSASKTSITSANAIVLDRVGVIYVAGTSNAMILFGNGNGDPNSTTDFLAGTATVDNWSEKTDPDNPNKHVFFAQIDPTGQDLLQATIAGGLLDDEGHSLSVTGYCFSSLSKKPDDTLAYPACVGVASIVGSTTELNQPTGLFGAAAVTSLYRVDPLLPNHLAGERAGFFVQEQLAGYCNMQLQQQHGLSLTWGGPCVSGTSSGVAFVKDNAGKIFKNAVTITGDSGLTPSGALTLDLNGLGAGPPFTVTFSFSPVGAIGAVGGCGLKGNGHPDGCPIIQTGGGGAGTLFNVNSGALAVALSCPGTNCSYNSAPNTVLIGQPVTLSAAVTNGVPNTVTWSSSAGTFSGPNPSTSITFTPGGTGGQIVITATPVADTSVSPVPTINLNTFESTSVSFANNGPFTYGQTNITIDVGSGAGSSSTPTGNITYQIDSGVNGSGALTLSGGSVPLQLASLSAGTHILAVSYPGDPASFLANSSNILNFIVNKAPLTVTATSPPPVTFGQAIPALTYATPTGFVNGDSVSVISGTATLSTTATNSSAPGDYPITFSTMALAATNYSFNYVNGTLTISPVGAAPAPIISPAGGSFSAPQTAAITSSVAGAKFYYTTDGTAPTETSASYTGPIAVSASETIRAIAVAVGYQSSAISNATFNLLPLTLSAPSISFGSIVQGILSGTRSIVLTNPGANAISGLGLKLGGANAAEFALTSGTTCGTTLAANSSCSVVGAFTPDSTGTRSAALAISYIGIGSPLVLNLEGIGASPLSVISSATQLVAGTTFQFTASGPAIWTASAGTISSSGFFTSPNPAPGPAQIIVTATSTSNPQISVTTQVTIFPVPAIVVPSSITLPAGGSVSVPMSIVPGTGIPGEAMTLACSPATLPTGVSCFFAPNPVVDAAGAPVTLQLFSNNSVRNNSPTRSHPWGEYPLNGFTVVVACCIFGFGRKKYGGRMMMVLILVLGSAAFLSLTACGTSNSLNGTTQGGHVTGTYTINISVSGASPGAADYNQTLTTVPLKVILQ